jgi:hypothetical protein
MSTTDVIYSGTQPYRELEIFRHPNYQAQVCPLLLNTSQGNNEAI